ncbi:putative reverse transcriptase domain-containing protein [Tanacetum coccineum]
MIKESVDVAIAAERARHANVRNDDRGSRPVRGQDAAPVVCECTFAGFMKCNPTAFYGIKGAVELLRWFEKTKSVFGIGECAEGKKVKFAAATLQGPALTWWNAKVVTMEEVQRIENELWNLEVKEYNIVAYTQRFNELALMCPRMVEPERVKVDAYIQGLTNNIKGEVTFSKPANMNKAVRMAHKLMEQKSQARDERILEGKERKWESFQSGNSSGKGNHRDNSRQTLQNNQKQGNARAMVTAPSDGKVPLRERCFTRHVGQCTIKCHKCGKIGHKARYCKEKNVATGANALPILTCYDCGEQGHTRNDAQGKLSKRRASYEVELADRRVHDAVIVCGEKVVRIPNRNQMLIVKSDKGVSRLKVISCIKACKYVKRGCHLFLEHVTENKSKKKRMEDVPIIRDFPEVFPKELPGLPPPRQVEFRIDLVPGAAPIARAPYRLAPYEMRELLCISVDSSRFVMTLSRIRHGSCTLQGESVFSESSCVQRKERIVRQVFKIEAIYELGYTARSRHSGDGLWKGTFVGMFRVVLSLLVCAGDFLRPRTNQGDLALYSRQFVDSPGMYYTTVRFELGAVVLALDFWRHLLFVIALCGTRCSGIQFVAVIRHGLMDLDMHECISPSIPISSEIRLSRALEYIWVACATTGDSCLDVDMITMVFVSGLPRERPCGYETDLGSVGDEFGLVYILSLPSIYMVNLSGFTNDGRSGKAYGTIKALPNEALYGRKYRSPICWSEVGVSQLTGPELIRDTTKKIVQIKNRLLTARSRQKSYAYRRAKPLEFEVGDMVLLKVSPWKGIMDFGKRGKLSLRYIGPFKILVIVGLVAYTLELPEELKGIHNTFHVSNLKKCLAKGDIVVLIDEIQLDDKLHMIEEPVEVVDKEVKQLKQSRIPIVKVCWNSQRGPEFTWEHEDHIKKKYPHSLYKYRSMRG